MIFDDDERFTMIFDRLLL